MKQKHLNIIFFIVLSLFLLSLFYKDSYPFIENVHTDILKEPIQKETKKNKFIFDYKSTTYEVEPVADYEIWGVIMDHNNIHSITDSYHDDNSVDLKDVCVVWGDNINSDVFKHITFQSGSWTCYVSSKNWDHWSKFNTSKFSNNHLISSDDKIQEQIKNVRIGDQIHIRGSLVNYKNKNSGWTRKTSQSRTDDGGTACEVIHVDQFEYLKRNNPIWNTLNIMTKYLMLFIILAKIFVFIMNRRKESKEFFKRHPR